MNKNLQHYCFANLLGDYFKRSWVQYKRKATIGSKGVAIERRVQVELGFRSELEKHMPIAIRCSFNNRSNF
jgi:hypothetical protein